MRKGILTLLLSLCALVAFSQASVQIIHNSPLPGSQVGPPVDIYVNGALLPELTNVQYRQATPFLDVPAGAPINVEVKVHPSTPADPNVFSTNLGSLNDQQSYVVIANGVAGISFGLDVNAMAKQAADDPATVEVAAFHGSLDAPNVDIGVRTLGNVFTDLAFGEFTDYAALSEGLFYIDVRATGSTDIVATFAADLNGLAGGAATVFASGYLADSPAFGLFAALPDGTVVELPAASISRVQLVHNASAPTVDVYASGTLLAADFAYRTATEFFFAPADVALDIQVVPAGGDPMMDDVYDGPDVTLENGATYVVMASGILGDMDTPFELQIEAMGQEQANDPDLVAVNVNHGSPDVPLVNVDLFGVFTGQIATGLEYGDFSGYAEAPAAAYFVEIEVPDLGGAVLTFYGDLRGLEGGAATVFASGQLGDGSLGIFAALASGDVVELPLVDFNSTLQIIHNSPAAGAEEVDLYLNGALTAESFPYLGATEYFVWPSDVELEIGIAPAGSTSVNDTLVNVPVTLAAGETYSVVAGGIPGDMDTPLTLQVLAGAKADPTDPATVEFTVLHGSPDAPNVDVDARAVGTLIEDLAYGEFSDYIAVDPAVYYIDVRAAGDPNIVATFEAPLDLFEGNSLTVFASGFLAAGDPAFGLYAAAADGTVYELQAVDIARYQIIHNSPDPSVDIYFNDELAYADVAFRQATPFDFAPAGVPINVKVVPAGSPIGDAVFDADVTFDDNGDTYTLIAHGVVGNGDTPFTVASYKGSSEVAGSGVGVDLLLFHGATDAPEVDVIIAGSPTVLFDDVAYGEFSDLINVSSDSYELAVTPADDNGNELVNYIADLTSLEGGAATVFASGFFSGDEPAFEVWVALADGTTFPLDQVVATENLNGTLNRFAMFPNPTNGSAFVELDMNEAVSMTMQVTDMTGRVLQTRNLGTVATGAQTFEMDFSELPTGMYSLRLISENGSTAVKFIKK